MKLQSKLPPEVAILFDHDQLPDKYFLNDKGYIN